jgi:hypothetical protein
LALEIFGIGVSTACIWGAVVRKDARARTKRNGCTQTCSTWETRKGSRGEDWRGLGGGGAWG